MNSTARTSTSKAASTSSLRQRRSRSPQQKQSKSKQQQSSHQPQQQHEETQSLLENGSPSKPLENNNNNESCRRSNSHHHHHHNGDGGKDKDEDKNYHTHPPPQSAIQLAWSIGMGSVVLIVVVILAAIVFWLSLFTGLYNPDASNGCPIPTFEYPDCSDAAMHIGEVDPPLKFEEWLELRQKFQNALQLGNAAGKKDFAPSMAKDWSETNTYGFVDMSTIEFRFTPGRGRAVYTTKPIAKGTKIWDSRYRAVFPNSCVAKIFFATQTNQQKCDAMFWGYSNTFYGNGIQYMFDLDGHGYINHGGGTESNAVHHFEGELNTDQYTVSRFFNKKRSGPLSSTNNNNNNDWWEKRNEPGAYGLYASKDIDAGDEITYNYEEIYNIGFGDWFQIFICRSLPIWDWWTL